jgi:hypothetical protein
MSDFIDSGEISIQALRSYIESHIGSNNISDEKLKTLFETMNTAGFSLPLGDFNAPHALSESYSAYPPADSAGIRFGSTSYMCWFNREGHEIIYEDGLIDDVGDRKENKLPISEITLTEHFYTSEDEIPSGKNIGDLKSVSGFNGKSTILGQAYITNYLPQGMFWKSDSADRWDRQQYIVLPDTETHFGTTDVVVDRNISTSFRTKPGEKYFLVFYINTITYDANEIFEIKIGTLPDTSDLYYDTFNASDAVDDTIYDSSAESDFTASSRTTYITFKMSGSNLGSFAIGDINIFSVSEVKDAELFRSFVQVDVSVYQPDIVNKTSTDQRQRIPLPRSNRIDGNAYAYSDYLTVAEDELPYLDQDIQDFLLEVGYNYYFFDDAGWLGLTTENTWNANGLQEYYRKGYQGFRKFSCMVRLSELEGFSPFLATKYGIVNTREGSILFSGELILPLVVDQPMPPYEVAPIYNIEIKSIQGCNAGIVSSSDMRANGYQSGQNNFDIVKFDFESNTEQILFSAETRSQIESAWKNTYLPIYNRKNSFTSNITRGGSALLPVDWSHTVVASKNYTSPIVYFNRVILESQYLFSNISASLANGPETQDLSLKQNMPKSNMIKASNFNDGIIYVLHPTNFQGWSGATSAPLEIDSAQSALIIYSKYTFTNDVFITSFNAGMYCYLLTDFDNSFYSFYMDVIRRSDLTNPIVNGAYYETKVRVQFEQELDDGSWQPVDLPETNGNNYYEISFAGRGETNNNKNFKFDVFFPTNTVIRVIITHNQPNWGTTSQSGYRQYQAGDIWNIKVDNIQLYGTSQIERFHYGMPIPEYGLSGHSIQPYYFVPVTNEAKSQINLSINKYSQILQNNFSQNALFVPRESAIGGTLASAGPAINWSLSGIVHSGATSIIDHNAWQTSGTASVSYSGNQLTISKTNGTQGYVYIKLSNLKQGKTCRLKFLSYSGSNFEVEIRRNVDLDPASEDELSDYGFNTKGYPGFQDNPFASGNFESFFTVNYPESNALEIRIYPTDSGSTVITGLEVDLFNTYIRSNSIVVNVDTVDLHLNLDAINDDKSSAYYIMLHELIHGAGLVGYFWNYYGYRATNSYPSQYNGPNALQQYQNIATEKINQLSLNINDFDISSLPIQGSSTHFAEYAKLSNGKIQPTFKNELMTPYYDLGRGILSKVTIGMLEDLGYDVDYSVAESSLLLEFSTDTSISSDSSSGSYDQIILKDSRRKIRRCDCGEH